MNQMKVENSIPPLFLIGELLMSTSTSDQSPNQSQKKTKSDELNCLWKRRVIFVPGETSMSEVVLQMKDLNISSVLVIDHLSDVVGIITERDIVQKFTLLDLKNKLSSKAFAVMSRPLIMARIDHLYEDIRTLFLQHKIRHFPVTQGGHKASDIVGIVTVTDLAAGWLNSAPKQESVPFKGQDRFIIVVGLEANKKLYSKLFKALSIEPIIDGDNELLVRRAIESKNPVILDLDGMGLEDIKRHLTDLKGHVEPVLLLSSDGKLVEPLKKVLNAQIFQVALKPLDVSEVLRLLNRVDSSKNKLTYHPEAV
jgi:CBS domain-containing protein